MFAKRMTNIQESFIREILKVTQQPDMISFAGGLPNPKFFPVEAISIASDKVLQEHGYEALQYSTTDGYRPLREYIAQRYADRYDLTVSADEILITNGSQQGLDLLGKLFLNPADKLLLEQPSYLGAIQAFSFYEPQFIAIPLLEDGLNIEVLTQAVKQHQPKLSYIIPNFQNPTGATYSLEKRQQIADLLIQHGGLLIEDNPYGELIFEGEPLSPLRTYLGEQGIMLGTFSKIIAPSFRLGWVCANRKIIAKLTIAKQAADLHTNYLAQRIIYQYLQDNNLDAHLAVIKEAYQHQRDVMLGMIKQHFPAEVSYIKPTGGMFIWAALPSGYSAQAMLQQAIQENVVFVPGHPFFVPDGGENCMRLSFSNTSPADVETGIQRLGAVMTRFLQDDVVYF
ncbi:PLP-dependent aminotransferase family protein [Anaerolineales bacterium HSG24]|nr:PLP-dependent aminotransferase family protein [Anaerolineales bacterium HSG24]